MGLNGFGVRMHREHVFIRRRLQIIDNKNFVLHEKTSIHDLFIFHLHRERIPECMKIIMKCCPFRKVEPVEPAERTKWASHSGDIGSVKLLVHQVLKASLLWLLVEAIGAIEISSLTVNYKE